MNRQFGVIVLAAGSSSRLGRPKQLLLYEGKTLVERATRTAIASGADEVIVVVGAEDLAVRRTLLDTPVTIARNDDWALGMGTSIRCGMELLSPSTDCVVIALCDQPHVTPMLLRSLAERQFETSSPIVASSYDGVMGAPSAFGKELFPSLKSLAGDSGARELIRNSPKSVELVEFSGGSLDIDTAEDYQHLVQTPTIVAEEDPDIE